MLEYTKFNNWYYGTQISALKEDKINIGVFNLAGVRALLKNPEVEVLVYKIKVSDKERLLRQLTRERNPNVDEIIRRYITDKEDFFNIDFDYIELENETIIDLDDIIVRFFIEGDRQDKLD